MPAAPRPRKDKGRKDPRNDKARRVYWAEQIAKQQQARVARKRFDRKKQKIPDGMPKRRPSKVVHVGAIEPLDYLLDVMRDVKVPRGVRLTAAVEALPYRHHKLTTDYTSDRNEQHRLIVEVIHPQLPAPAKVIEGTPIDRPEQG